MASIAEFQEVVPTLESYWRSIILFGSNVASYKFALGKSLLELSEQGKTHITLDELAVPFSKHICEHLQSAPKQATSQSSRFLNACKDYNDGKISYDKLISTTVSLGFNNVIDAFHVVNRENIPIQFYVKDYSGLNKQIILTDEIYKLKENPFSGNLTVETESRWNLIETAWELGINRNLLNVRYDDKSQVLFVDEDYRRKDVTSVRGALNGYQKGKCFYCYDDIVVTDDETNTCDVDHFFPHMLQPFMPDINLDGVWNLVLTCRDCNRGPKGKFAQVPAIKYLERLYKRNEFLISSHHPLRETIIRQTGSTPQARHDFLAMVDKRAINNLITRWSIEPKGDATF